VEEERFDDYFETRDLVPDSWNQIEGLEVMPMVSPHPVEASVLVFRTLWGDGYRSYAHFADIVSLDVLRGMVTEDADAPGLSQEAFEQIRKAYALEADLKKIDIGGGMIHGSAVDFRADASRQLLLAHRASELTPQEKEIGSSAAFGSVDVLVAGQSDGLRHLAFGYLAAHLPGVPLHDLRMLVNHPMTEINPGTIILREGATPGEVLLLVSGLVEKLRTRDNLYASLPVGSLIGGSAILDNRASLHTYRASSFVQVLPLPPGLFAAVVERNGLLERVRRAADLNAFLDTTTLFGDGLEIAVLGRIVEAASERRLRPGEVLLEQDLSAFSIIRSGRVERRVGRNAVEVLQARDFFGEESAVFNAPCLYRIHVIEETSVVQIPGRVLQDIPILRWKLFEYDQQRASGRDRTAEIVWSDAYAVGVAQMDLHHRRLMEIANIVAQNLYPDADRHALASAFDALIGYSRTHFAAEEKLMALYAYPGAAAHCRTHANLLGELTPYSAQAQAGGALDKAAFVKFFESWLVRHICDEDRDYGGFLNARGVY
jgi:hemerythrin